MEHVFHIDWKGNFWKAHSVFPLCICKSEISSKGARDWIEILHLKKYYYDDQIHARLSVISLNVSSGIFSPFQDFLTLGHLLSLKPPRGLLTPHSLVGVFPQMFSQLSVFRSIHSA